VALAKRMTRDQPIPAESSLFGDWTNCFAEPTDTYVAAFDGHHELRLTSRDHFGNPCDERVFESRRQARTLARRPTPLSSTNIREVYAATPPQLLSLSRGMGAFYARSALPACALVDGLDIDDRDMPPINADGSFARNRGGLARRCRLRRRSKEVLGRLTSIHIRKYSAMARRSPCTLQRVATNGDFVISERDHSARPFRSADLPEQHVRPLLSGRTR